MRKTQKGKGEKGGPGEDRREEAERKREEKREEYRVMTSLAHCFIHVVNIYSVEYFLCTRQWMRNMMTTLMKVSLALWYIKQLLTKILGYLGCTSPLHFKPE